MIVFLKVENYSYEMGDPTWFRNFFENVIDHIEGGEFGSKLPNIFEFYQKEEIAIEKLDNFKKEMLYVKEEFSKIDIKDIVWYTYKSEKVRCPYLDILSDDIFTLSDFWRTSHEAKDMFEVVCVAIEDAKKLNRDLKLEYFELKETDKKLISFDIHGQDVDQKDLNDMKEQLKEGYVLIFKKE